MSVQFEIQSKNHRKRQKIGFIGRGKPPTTCMSLPNLYRVNLAMSAIRTRTFRGDRL